MAKKQNNDMVLPLVAGLLAWLVPGAGHVYLRRTVRGIILCLAINALFWSGMAIGGVFTVEPIRERWWYAAQMCTGVSGLAGWYRQDRTRKSIIDEHLRGLRRGEPTALSYKEYMEILAKRRLALVHPSDIVARAYTGIAGMLNLLCIFDAVVLALMGRLGEPPRPAPEPVKEAAT